MIRNLFGDKLTAPPIQGIRYEVLCIQNNMGEWLPVIGPEHADPELNNPRIHIHLDTRFMAKDEISKHGPGRNIPVIWTDGKKATLRYMVRTCLRSSFVDGYGITDIKDKPLEELMSDAKMSCMTCPHRHFDLSTVKPEGDGTVLCPGHGLQWDIATGKLLARYSWGEMYYKLFLESGQELSNPTIRLFVNDLEERDMVNPPKEIRGSKPVSYDVNYFNKERPFLSREIPEATIECLLPYSQIVYGYFLTADNWDKPIWIEKFPNMPYNMPYGSCDLIINLGAYYKDY